MRENLAGVGIGRRSSIIYVSIERLTIVVIEGSPNLATVVCINHASLKDGDVWSRFSSTALSHLSDKSSDEFLGLVVVTDKRGDRNSAVRRSSVGVHYS
jgi:hypothetical protein